MKAALSTTPRGVKTLDELRSLLHTKIRKEAVGFSLLPSGIPKGAITSISGVGKTEFVLQLLSEQPDLKVAWIEDSFSIFPFGFVQRKIKLDRILFVDAGKDLFWATLEALRSQTFTVVVFYGETSDLSLLRRVQLETEKSNAMTLWLSPEPPALWPVSLQLQVQKRRNGLINSLEVQILKSKQ